MEDTDQSSDGEDVRERIRLETVRNEIDPDLTCEVPAGEVDDDGEEKVCGNGQDLENGVVVGYRSDSDIPECNLCIEEWFKGETNGDDNTFLAERESQIVALKALGRTHSQISELLTNRFGEEGGPSLGTVSSHSRRARNKYFRAVRTAIELGPVFDPNMGDEDEQEQDEEREPEQVEA